MARPPPKVLTGTPAWVQTDLAPHTGSDRLPLRSTLDAICSLLTDISSVNWWAACSYTRLIRDHLECAMGLDGEDTLQAQIIEWVAQWIGGTVSIKLKTQLHMQMSGGVCTWNIQEGGSNTAIRWLGASQLHQSAGVMQVYPLSCDGYGPSNSIPSPRLLP